MAYSRAREVGVRKVFGAGYLHIIKVITKDINFLVFISAPVSLFLFLLYYQQLTTKYAYHIPLPLWIFPLSVIMVWIVALLAAFWSVLKTVTIKPVDVLGSD